VRCHRGLEGLADGSRRRAVIAPAAHARVGGSGPLSLGSSCLGAFAAGHVELTLHALRLAGIAPTAASPAATAITSAVTSSIPAVIAALIAAGLALGAGHGIAPWLSQCGGWIAIDLLCRCAGVGHEALTLGHCGRRLVATLAATAPTAPTPAASVTVSLGAFTHRDGVDEVGRGTIGRLGRSSGSRCTFAARCARCIATGAAPCGSLFTGVARRRATGRIRFRGLRVTAWAAAVTGLAAFAAVPTVATVTAAAVAAVAVASIGAAFASALTAPLAATLCTALTATLATAVPVVPIGALAALASGAPLAAVTPFAAAALAVGAWRGAV
jgi:hypothetical protein